MPSCQKYIKILLTFIYSLIIVSCIGNCDTDTTSEEDRDEDSKMLVSFDLKNGSLISGDFPNSRTPMIVLKFPESMNITTINSSTINLIDDDNIAVEISNITTEDNIRFHFFPKVVLKANTNYKVSLLSGMITKSGLEINPGMLSFVTGDFIAPMVSIMRPISEAESVSIAPAIKFKVSKSVTNIHSNTVSLHEGNAEGPKISLSAFILGDNNEYITYPKSDLKSNTTYHLVFDDEIVDTEGNGIFGLKSYSFTTELIDDSSTITPLIPTIPETNTKLEVTMLSPSNNADNISRSPSVKFQFSNSVKNISGTTVTLRKGSLTGSPVAISAITLSDNNIYTFTLNIELDELTRYYVVFTDAIADDNGNKLEQTNFSFTTGKFSAPVVTMLTPSNNADNISRSPSIKFQFSNSVKNVSGTTVTLRKGTLTGSPVAISAITLSDNNIYTFTPNIELDELTRYYVVFTDAITDDNGNKLEQTNFSFTTGKFSAPVVTMLTPSNNADNISKSPSVKFQFSNSVKNISGTTVTLRKGSLTGSPVAISAITLSDNNIYTFTPNIELDELTRYYVVFTDAIADDNGNKLEQTNFSFTTGKFSAPVVTMLSPSNNADNISRSPSVKFQFSNSVKNVSGTTVTLRKGSLTGSSVDIGAITLSDNNIYTFTPNIELDELTRYYLVITDAIADDNGNKLEQTNFSFTTGKFSAPVVTMLTPSNNADNISRSPSIKFQFSNSVKNVSGTTVTLRKGSLTGGAVDIGAITLSDNNIYTFTPNIELDELTRYYVVFTDAITDDNGRKLEQTSFSFTTGEFIAPVVTMLSPSNNASQVNLTPVIKLQFSEPVRNVAENVKLKLSNESSVPITIIHNSDNQYEVKPKVALILGEVYSLELASNITDLFNNRLKDTSFQFTTKDESVGLVPVGKSQFSGKGYYNSSAISPDGVLYVTYKDLDNGDKTTVMKFESEQWINVGKPGFSSGVADFQSLVVAPDGTPYVAYRDSAFLNKTMVMKFENNNWVNVGESGLANHLSEHQSLAVSPDGTLYVAYSDGAAHKGTIKKFDKVTNKWVDVSGSSFFSSDNVQQISLATDSKGVLYVAFINFGSTNGILNRKARVLRLNSNKWQDLGELSNFNEQHISLAISSDDVPYVVYVTPEPSSTLAVKKYLNNSWQNVGDSYVTSNAPARYAAISIAPNGTPYVAYSRPMTGINNVWTSDFYLLVLSGDNQWLEISSKPLHTVHWYPLSLTVGSDGSPYIAYYFPVSQKMTVVKF